jgi:hypothetical protein
MLFESVKVLVVVDAELLDIEQPGALVGYLKVTGRVGEGEEPVVRVLAGGVSNRTVLIERPEAGEAWVVKQALPKLRVAVDWFSDPDRVHRRPLGCAGWKNSRPRARSRRLFLRIAVITFSRWRRCPSLTKTGRRCCSGAVWRATTSSSSGGFLGTVHRGVTKRGR